MTGGELNDVILLIKIIDTSFWSTYVAFRTYYWIFHFHSKIRSFNGTENQIPLRSMEWNGKHPYKTKEYLLS